MKPLDPAVLEFWFDYTCPYAYLASVAVSGLAARTGRTLRWRPMLLGGVFRALDVPQRLFATVGPAKAAHTARDLERQAALLGVGLGFPAEHPQRSVEALRVTLATGCDPRVIAGFFARYWVDRAPISTPEGVTAVLEGAGYGPAEVARYREAAEAPEAREALRAATDEAIAHGIFGAPAFRHDDASIYWGADRMILLEPRPDPTPHPSPRTMPHTLEVFFDFSSPYAYLGQTQAEALAARTGATLVWRPILLGGLFKAIGQAMVPMQTWSAAKQQHTLVDMGRWAAHWQVPFRFPDNFPFNSVKALRVWLALPEARRDAFRQAAYNAAWADNRDLTSDAVLADLIGDDAEAILARTQDADIKQQLIDSTQDAVARGVFGAPTWIVDKTELFWGQDRLPLVERALAG